MLVEDQKNSTVIPFSSFDVVLIPGSSHSVYEDLEWMLKLKALIKRIILDEETHLRVVAGCFGCQMVASALGKR